MLTVLCLLNLWMTSLAEELTPKQKSKAARMLASADKDERRKAFQALWQWGDDAKPVMESLLDRAEIFHRKQLDQTIAKASPTTRAFLKARQDWQKQCEETLTFARRDLGNDSAAFKRLDSRVLQASRDHQAVVKSSKGLESLWPKVRAQAQILQELRVEAAMLAGNDEPDIPELDVVIEDSDGGKRVLEAQAHWLAWQHSLEAQARADVYNRRGAKWPSRPQRAFVARINEDRASLGLPALFLQAQLSAACEGHSQEMRQLGYFSHDSPTPGRTSPWDRAKLVKYDQRAMGENIFMGDASPQAAYRAWWLSDGHRKIMLLDRSNHLGVALVGKHWTMMMGRGEEPATSQD